MSKGVNLTNTKGLGVYITLDRSGSMATMWDEAIGSLNAYIETLKKEETDKDYITIATFDDTGYEVPVNNIKLKSLKNVTKEIATPRGMTPLFDSVAKTINKAKEENHDRTVVVIITDGHENASKEYKKEAVTKLIKECEKKDWEVIFLGANFDVSQDATALGVGYSKFVSTSTMNFAPEMSKLAGRTRAYASFGSSINYTDEDKAAAVADKNS